MNNHILVSFTPWVLDSYAPWFLGGFALALGTSLFVLSGGYMWSLPTGYMWSALPSVCLSITLGMGILAMKIGRVVYKKLKEESAIKNDKVVEKKQKLPLPVRKTSQYSLGATITNADESEGNPFIKDRQL
jgi:hypothetical protein